MNNTLTWNRKSNDLSHSLHYYRMSLQPRSIVVLVNIGNSHYRYCKADSTARIHRRKRDQCSIVRRSNHLVKSEMYMGFACRQKRT